MAELKSVLTAAEFNVLDRYYGIESSRLSYKEPSELLGCENKTTLKTKRLNILKKARTSLAEKGIHSFDDI